MPAGTFNSYCVSRTGVVQRRSSGLSAWISSIVVSVHSATRRRSTGRGNVTGELTVRYVQPVPLETPILGHGRLVTDHGRYLDVEGRLEELATGRLLATARGRFFPLPPGSAAPPASLSGPPAPVLR